MPILQMTDTGITFPSCYNTVGHARVYVMALTSPPSLPLSRLWAELSVRRFMSSPLLIQGSSRLSVVPKIVSASWKFKNLTLSVTPSLPTLTGILFGHPSRPVSIAESQPALKVSFNRPRPRSQPARAAGRVCWLFIFFHGS